MKLSYLLEKIEYTLLRGDLETKVSSVVYNTENIVDGCMFVCMRGAKVDGHAFAKRAVKDGATVLIVEEDVPVTGVSVVQVKDARYALALVSAAFFGYPAKKLTTIGITGSKGKTTTAYMLRNILEKAGNKTGIIASIDAEIDGKRIATANTTPESFEIQKLLSRMVDKGCTHAVIEASSQGFKLHRTAGIEFDYGLFLNFSRDHIGPTEHASIEEYLYCKSMLFRQCKVGFLNKDDKHVDDILKGHTSKVFTFGFSKDADVYVSEYKPTRVHSRMGIAFKTDGMYTLNMFVSYPGTFTVYNALAAAGIAKMCGVSDEVLTYALDDITIRGRVETVPIGAPYTVIIDFAHNGIGVQKLIEGIREYKSNRIIGLFGADGGRSKIRRADVGEVLGEFADFTIITANNPGFENLDDINKEIESGLLETNGDYVIIDDRKEAIRYAMEMAEPNDMILLMGKGDEETEIVKGVHYPFDERVVVRELYKEIMGKNNA